MSTDALQRHETYYIPGGDLHFLVGRTRFRVHSFFFIRDSRYWRNRMAGPVSPGTNYGRPGFDESTAFLVEDIEAEDFAQFLWIFYNPLHDIYDTSLGNWEIILKLANQWECERIREVAVEHIDRLPGVTDIHKIKIYRDNDVPRRFFIPLYIALARRERRLERREFQYLDNEDLYYIVTAREMLRAPLPPLGGRGGTNRLASPSPMRRDISEEEIFATAFGMTVEEIQAIMSPDADIGPARWA